MSIAVSLPGKTLVTVIAATNAQCKQRVTLEYGADSQVTWEGTGEGNHRIGQMDILTSRGSKKPYSYQVKVTIEHRSPAGEWVPSRIQEDCEPRIVAGMATIFVWSEDGNPADEDWDDTVVRFTWMEQS